MTQRFEQGFRAAVIGTSGGLGGAFAALLRADPRCGGVVTFARSGAADHRLDITDEASIAAAAAACGPVSLVIIATGLLHAPELQPEKDLRALDAARLARSFAVNAIGPALVAKHFLPLLPRRGHAVFACLSARVGSIEDNRVGGWYGYRASKAALNMLLKNAAIETARRRPETVILALQPGTVDTGLSRPFQGAAHDIFAPEDSARHLLGVIGRAEPGWSGGLYDWRGERIPF
jgi:NAD(P)-dependent dehydrogenase (short-subunit alcohol dehydrogenase family)